MSQSATSARMTPISMWASSCYFATLSLKTLISCCVARLCTSDSSIGSQTYIFAVAFETEDTEQIQMAIMIPPPFPSFLQPLIGSQTYIFSIAFEIEDTERFRWRFWQACITDSGECLDHCIIT